MRTLSIRKNLSLLSLSKVFKIKTFLFTSQMHYRFSTSRIVTMWLSDRPRKDYLSSAVRLLLAGGGHLDTALHRSATDLSPDRTS